MNNKTFKVGFNHSEIKINNFSVSCNINFEPDSDVLILCIHGLGCDKNSFTKIFDYPDFKEYNILIPDLIGFGKSSKPKGFLYNLEAQAELVSEAVSFFDIKKIHIVGHSMGGAVALLLPQKIYSKVESFANIEGNLISADCNMFSRKIVSGTVEEYTKDLFEQHSKQFKQSKLLCLSSTTPEVMYHSAKSLVELSDNQNLIDDFKKIKARKAYFFGEDNMDADIISKLNGIERVMIAGSGHEMMFENPNEFYNRLYDFINNLL